MSLLSPNSKYQGVGFSLGSVDKASTENHARDDVIHSEDSTKGPSDSEKYDVKRGISRLASEPKRSGSGLNKSKRKRNRRKERKRNVSKSKSLKIVGVNAAGIKNKLDSF